MAHETMGNLESLS